MVNDLVHLLAELLENATSFSSPQTKVKVTGHALPDGRVLIEIHDTGIGLSPEDLAAINERLASPPTVDVSVSRRMGLFVVGRLSQRHGIRIQLRPSDSGGTTALVMLPVDVAQGGKKPQGKPGQPGGAGGPAAAQAAAGAAAARRSAGAGQSGGGSLGASAPGGRLGAGQGPRAALPGRDGSGGPGGRGPQGPRRATRPLRCSTRALLRSPQGRPAPAGAGFGQQGPSAPQAASGNQGQVPPQRGNAPSAAAVRSSAARQRPSGAAGRRPAAHAELGRRERPPAGATPLGGRPARPRRGRLPHGRDAALRRPSGPRRHGGDPRFDEQQHAPGQDTGQYGRPGANGPQNTGQFVRGDIFGAPQGGRHGAQNPASTGQFPASQGYGNANGTGQYPAQGQNNGSTGQYALPARPGSDPSGTGQFERPQVNGGAPVPPRPQAPQAPQQPQRQPSDQWALPPATGPGDGRTPLYDTLETNWFRGGQGGAQEQGNGSAPAAPQQQPQQQSPNRRAPQARSGPMPPGAARPTTSSSSRPNASANRPRAASPPPACRAGCPRRTSSRARLSSRTTRAVLRSRAPPMTCAAG
ncbi:sensor histidine kinase [Streptomyces thermocarboxydus]